MPVPGCDTVAGGTDPEFGIGHATRIQFAHDFTRLFFQLGLLAPDKGDYVVEDVERGNAGITGAAERLHGGDKNAFQTKGIVERLERKREVDGRAVGVTN